MRSATLAAATSLIIALNCGPSMAAEFASKEEAIAMVKKAISQIKKQGPD
jgi:cytochrome c